MPFQVRVKSNACSLQDVKQRCVLHAVNLILTLLQTDFTYLVTYLSCVGMPTIVEESNNVESVCIIITRVCI